MAIASIKAQIEDEWDCVLQKGNTLFIRNNQETFYTVLKLGEKFIVTDCRKCKMYIVMTIDDVINLIQ